ncbi:MAG: polysaccharide deacetylase family protein [Bacteroidales bacterium]|nr:polysaccharide deacetylase family protein [Bacteroidales bacterium]
MSFVIQPYDIVRKPYRHSIWRLPVGFSAEESPRLSLTFDDGPIPEQTPWVLDMLDKYGVKATFFCVGDNIRKYPDVFREVIARGHEVGNHTYHHVQLMKTTWKEYVEEIRLCKEEALKACDEARMRLFRAPHGQMLPWRCKEIVEGTTERTKGLEIEKLVFWDVMPKDYDKRLTPQEVLRNVKDYVRDGSVIVIHDSVKSGERMRYALEGTLEWAMEKGWKVSPIPN